MSLTYSDYINFLQTSTVLPYRVKLELLRSDETIYQPYTAEIIGGSLSAQRANGTRRSCTLDVCNTSNDFTPTPLKLWLNTKFKLSIGYEINGEIYWRSAGIFGLRDPQTLHDKSDKTATITAIDKWGFLDGSLNGRLDGTYSIPVGTSIKTAIESVLSLCNDPIPPLLIIDPSIVTPYTIYQEYGKTYADVLLELNNILAYNMYYDVNGRFTCMAAIDNNTKGSVFDFTTDTAHYMHLDQKFGFEQSYNIVKVTGDNVNGNIATGIATNADPTSPLSTLNIGNRLAPAITDANINTDALAQYRAGYELQRYATLAVDGNITCIPILHLDVDDIITVTDSDELLNRERFLVNSFGLPLSPQAGQTMSLSVARGSQINFTISYA